MDFVPVNAISISGLCVQVFSVHCSSFRRPLLVMSERTFLSPPARSAMSVPGHVLPDLPYSRPASPALHQHAIGFLGLGAMGYPMARNLARSRPIAPNSPPSLLVYNRTKARSESLLNELGPERIAIADSPEQLIKDCDIIITSLANDEAIKAVYEAFSKALEVCTYNKQPTSICRIIT